MVCSIYRRCRWWLRGRRRPWLQKTGTVKDKIFSLVFHFPFILFPSWSSWWRDLDKCSFLVVGSNFLVYPKISHILWLVPKLYITFHKWGPFYSTERSIASRSSPTKKIMVRNADGGGGERHPECKTYVAEKFGVQIEDIWASGWKRQIYFLLVGSMRILFGLFWWVWQLTFCIFLCISIMHLNFIYLVNINK